MANNEKDPRGLENPEDQKDLTGNPDKKAAKAKTGTSNRGFASMDQARHREISAMGGRASHESGRGHEFDSEEARAAGRKGGQASHGGRGRTQVPRTDEEDTDNKAFKNPGDTNREPLL